MDLIEHKREISRDGNVYLVAYDTNFVDCDDDCITIYWQIKERHFTDNRDTADALDRNVSCWNDYEIVEKICKRYGCKIGLNYELQAPHGSQLIQAILAIYAWIEFKGTKL
ncbi:hypothetical protein [Limosilactobacillus mucosae]|uniref:hypothetical protein n=1 Tax=Limosilactobacillus mucosae TaxID=97478 RepID=UPI000FFC1E6B|nr:hypothetical protein [Limosilactobacillus mucosae]RXA58158.1 hypothetical protein EQ839_02920 [Limosilactobacillus mucosae]